MAESPKNQLTVANEAYLSQVSTQLEGHNIQFSEYQRTCVIHAISAVQSVLEAANINWNDVNQPSITQSLIKVATLKLNAAATPREVYFQIRKVKHGDKWVKHLEMGIEGDGNDAILRNFGVGIDKIGQIWLVRENDKFTYQKYNGFDVEPPTWEPSGKGKVIRVVYPIRKVDGSVEYHIAERADVKSNLIAHIINNMQNETFGICADRYKATPEQKAQIAAKKQEVRSKISPLSLDEILALPDVQKWISPSWSEPHSQEAMIIRKMRNNATKKIPKDFGSRFTERMFAEATDESVRDVSDNISVNANTGEVIDVDFTEEPEATETKADTTPKGAEEYDPFED